MKKPAQGGLWWKMRGMSFIGLMWVKLVLVVVAAFLYGLFGGLTGRGEEGPNDKDPE